MAERTVGPESQLRNQATRAELRRCVDLLVALRTNTIKRKSVPPGAFNARKGVWDYNARLRNTSASKKRQYTIKMAHVPHLIELPHLFEQPKVGQCLKTLKSSPLYVTL